MFCLYCGQHNEDGSKFCIYCGAALTPVTPQTPTPPAETVPTPEVPEVPPVTEIPVTETPVTETPVTETPVTETPVTETAAPAEQPPRTTQAEQAPSVPARPAKPPKAPFVPKSPGCLSRMFSSFLAFLLCILILSASLLTAVRFSLTPDMVAEWIGNINLTEITLVTESGKNVTLAEYASDICRDNGISDTMTPRGMESLLESKLVKDFLADTANEYGAYLTDGSTKGGLYPEKIVKFIQKNEKEIQRIVNKAGVKGELDFKYDVIEEKLDEMLGDNYRISKLAKNDVVSSVRVMFSDRILILSWAICGIFALLLLLLNLSYVSSFLTHMAVVTLTNGALFATGYLLSDMVLDMALPSALYQVITPMTTGFLRMGIILIAAGVLFVVLRIVAGIIRSARSRA